MAGAKTAFPRGEGGRGKDCAPSGMGVAGAQTAQLPRGGGGRGKDCAPTDVGLTKTEWQTTSLKVEYLVVSRDRRRPVKVRFAA